MRTDTATAFIEANDPSDHLAGDAACQHGLDVSTDRRGGEIFANSSNSDAARPGAAFDCAMHEIVRTRQEGASAMEDCYFIALQLSGHGRIAQDGVHLTVAPSEIAIIDGRRPFRAKFPESSSRIILVIPRDMADRRAPWLRQRHPGKVMTSDSPYADLARQHLAHLAAGKHQLGETAVGLLIDNLFNLFTLANLPAVASDGSAKAPSLQSLLAFCRRNLQEAKLSPRYLAVHFSISIRTVHLRFAKLGQSFNRWLLEARLEACGSALRDPNWSGHTISEVAYRCGFNDLSHFNKTFRARFDATPRQWRALGRADTGARELPEPSVSPRHPAIGGRPLR